MSPVAVAFGRALREARMRAGHTQEHLAALAGIDRTYTSMLERGTRTPTLTVFFRLSDALALRPAALIESTVARLRTLRE